MFCGLASRGESSWKRTSLSVIVLILLTAALRVSLLNIPFERDEGEYAYIAWRLDHHELPYRDWIDQKPPGIFWMYRLALNSGLAPIPAVHALALVISAASACALFFLARRFLDDFWAIGAAAIFALLSADPLAEGTAANTEVFMLLPLILAQIAFLESVWKDRPRRAWWMFLCGVFTGLAVAFKQVAFVNWPWLVLLCPLFVPPGKRAAETIRFAVASAAGVAAVWIPIVLYFTIRGGLPDFIYNVFTHNLEYVHAMSWAERWHNCVGTLAALSRTQALVWIAVVVGLVALARTGPRRTGAFAGGWLTASFLGVSASGYFFPHYFQQSWPALALLAACGADALDRARILAGIPKPARRGLILGGLAALPVFAAFPFLFQYSPSDAVGRIYPGNFFAEMPALASRLAQITRPADRVFIFGAEPEVLFYARRVSSTRYIFLFPLYGPYRDAREKQLATAKEILDHAPAAALYLPNSLFFAPGTEQYFTEWSQAYLRTNFAPDTCLTLDGEGIPSVVRYSQGGVSEGQRIIGWLLAKAAR